MDRDCLQWCRMAISPHARKRQLELQRKTYSTNVEDCCRIIYPARVQAKYKSLEYNGGNTASEHIVGAMHEGLHCCGCSFHQATFGILDGTQSEYCATSAACTEEKCTCRNCSLAPTPSILKYDIII